MLGSHPAARCGPAQLLSTHHWFHSWAKADNQMPLVHSLTFMAACRPHAARTGPGRIGGGGAEGVRVSAGPGVEEHIWIDM
jgi:hypothetical protein